MLEQTGGWIALGGHGLESDACLSETKWTHVARAHLGTRNGCAKRRALAVRVALAVVTHVVV